MSWASTYSNRLNYLRSVAGPPERQNPLDIAYKVLSTKTKMQDYSKMGSATGGTSKDFSPGNIASGTWSAAKSTLDFIERPFYSIMGATKAAMDDPNNNSQSPWIRAIMSTSGPGLIANLVTQPGAVARGLSGQDHTTSSDIYSKYMPGFDTMNPVAKFGLSMGTDLVADPLTYVGPGAIKAVAKAGFKLAGKAGLGSGVAPKLGRATNTTVSALPEPKPQAFIPSSLIKKDLAATGVAKTSDAAAETFVQKMARQEARTQIQPEKILPYKWTDSSPKVFAPPAPTPAELSASQLVDRAMVNTVSKGFSELSTKAHPSGIKIDPIYKVADVVSTPKLPVPTATPKAIDTSITESQRIAEHVAKVETAGKEAHPLYTATGKRAYQQAPLTGKGIVPAKLEKPKRLLMRSSTLAKLIKTGVDDSAYSIKVNGKLVPLSKFAKDAHANLKVKPATSFADEFTAEAAANAVSKGTKGPTKVAKAAEQAAVPPTGPAAMRRLTPGEVAIWRAKHPHLTTEEVQSIFKARSAESAAKRIADIKLARSAVTTQGGIKGFSDIEKAIASGAIDPKDPVFQEAIQKIVSSTGIKQKGVKGQEAAQRRITKAFENIAKAEADKVKFSPKDLKTVGDYLAKERLTSLIDNPVASKVEAKVITAKDLAVGIFKHGDTTVFNKTKIVLDTAQHEAVQRVIQRATTSQIVEPKGWIFRTNKNIPRTSKTPGLGTAKQPSMNIWSQYTIGKDLLNESIKLIDPTLKGPTRSFELYNKFMPMLHASEQMLRQSGLPIILGDKAVGLPLSLHDILSALPRQFVEHYFFNKQSAIDLTQFGKITQQLVRLSKKEITPLQFDEVTSKILGAARNTNVDSGVTRQFSNYASMKKFGDTKVLASTNQMVANTFKASSVNIMQALERNSAEAGIEIGQHAAKLTDEAMNKFAKVILDDNVLPSDIIGLVTNPAKLIDEAAVGITEPVSAGAKDLAKIQLEVRIADVVDSNGVNAAAKAAGKYSALLTEKVRKAGNWEKVLASDKAAIASEQFRVFDEEAAQIMKDAGFATTDLGMRAEFANYVGITRAFFPHMGNEQLRPLLLGYHNLGQRDAMLYTAKLSKLSKGSTVEQQAEAFRYLQKGELPKDPAMIKITQDIGKVWNEVLGDTHDKFGFIGRNGISARDLQSKFDHYSINSREFPLDPNDVVNSWRKWDVKDPLVIASKVHAAAQAVIAEKVLGASFSMNFGSKVWKPGMVKITNSGGRSRVAELIDTGLFYEKDIAQQMHLIDKTLEEFAKPATNNKFLRLLDSTLHSYKAGLTIYNLGHHTRNMTGDMWLSYMDGMTDPRYYTKGLVVLATRNAKHEGFDAIAAAKSAGVTDMNKSVLNVTYKGKKIDLSPSQEYDLGYNVGLYPSYSVLEDLNMDARAAGDLTTNLRTRSPFKGNIQKVAAGVSEYRDHWVRAAQFNWLMKNTVLDSSKSLQDALRIASEKAGSRVRKTHPDGSDLSAMERAVMRRSVLFYSWIRKAIPLVATGMVQRPGRFMMYPKATYNLAESQGIDLKSIGDQFPTDQLFPAWMEDGTQGVMFGGPNNYWQSKPGIPASDVMDQYGTNPLGTLRTIMGSTNPLARIPYEMASGNSMGTGSKIKDKSEYVDSQLPFAGFIDKITGRSVSSAFTQPLTVSKSNENYVPTVPVWLQQLLNKNLGAGVTDMSKPSYIKQGQFAARDAARNAANQAGN